MKITGVICFGDSIIAGTGASERELGCAKLIKTALSVPVSLRGRNWNTSQDGLERIKEDVLRQESYSHVIVLFGNNDCWLVGPNQPKISLEKFRENIIGITERIKSNNQIPVLCNLQPIDSQRFSNQFPELFEYQKSLRFDPTQLQKQYSEEIQHLADDMKITWINIRKELESCLEEAIASDGLHPNNKGHNLIANSIITVLKRLDPSLDTVAVKQNSLEK